MKISAIIITKNEQDKIKECIRNLVFADEIVVIDNQSKDDTAKIALSLGARIFPAKGTDFSYMRNLGKEKAISEWLFYVDSDEIVSKELVKELKLVLNNPGDIKAISILRSNYYFDKAWPKKERIVRIIKKDALIGWRGSLHETPIIAGNIYPLSSIMKHFTHNNLNSMLIKTNNWSDMEASLRYKNNHPMMTWWRFFRVMITAFWRSYITEGGWKIGTEGLIESIYQSFSMFITYAKLWEKQTKR